MWPLIFGRRVVATMSWYARVPGFARILMLLFISCCPLNVFNVPFLSFAHYVVYHPQSNFRHQELEDFRHKAWWMMNIYCLFFFFFGSQSLKTEDTIKWTQRAMPESYVFSMINCSSMKRSHRLCITHRILGTRKSVSFCYCTTKQRQQPKEVTLAKSGWKEEKHFKVECFQFR